MKFGMVESVLSAIIGIIVVFYVLAGTAADLGYAADNITAQSSTLPLTSLFKRGGVVFLILMAGVLVAVFGWARFHKK